MTVPADETDDRRPSFRNELFSDDTTDSSQPVGQDKRGALRSRPDPGARTETMKRRITRTVVETHEVIRVTAGEPPLLVLCPECGLETGYVRPEIAAREAGMSQRELFRRIEAGRIHHLESSDGGILVCTTSVTRSKNELNP